MKSLILETRIQGREDFVVRNIKKCIQYIYSLCKLLEKILLGVVDMQEKIRKIVFTFLKNFS